ncbi:MAG TPA: DeoR family transcriptional regulator, partial [Galbitalea sp.]
APILPALRRRRLAETLLSTGAVTVREVVRATAVSSATARRDLDDLARQGIAIRVHGGAVAHHVLHETFLPAMLSHADGCRCYAARGSQLFETNGRQAAVGGPFIAERPCESDD